MGKNREPEFLMPLRCGYPLDTVLDDIVQELRKRDWQSPDLDIELRELRFGGNRGIYSCLHLISGKDFEIKFESPNRPRELCAPRASCIVIPRMKLLLPGPGLSYGPTLLIHDDTELLRRTSDYGLRELLEQEAVRYGNFEYVQWIEAEGELRQTLALSDYFENKSRTDLGRYRDGIGHKVLVRSVMQMYIDWLRENVLEAIKRS